MVGPKYPLVSIVNGRGMPKSSQAISKIMSCRPSQRLCHVRIGYPPNLIPKMVVQLKGRIPYSHSSSERFLSWHETAAPKPPRSLTSWCIEGSIGNLCSLRKSSYCKWVLGANNNQRKVDQAPLLQILLAPYIQN